MQATVDWFTQHRYHLKGDNCHFFATKCQLGLVKSLLAYFLCALYIAEKSTLLGLKYHLMGPSSMPPYQLPWKSQSNCGVFLSIDGDKFEHKE